MSIENKIEGELWIPNYKARQLDKENILSEFKGELIHLILSNINPQELKFCKTQKEIDSNLQINTSLQRMYILIGKIVEQIKR